MEKERQRYLASSLPYKQKREMKEPTAMTMKNGKPATTGTCATCGTKLFKIGKTPESP